MIDRRTILTLPILTAVTAASASPKTRRPAAGPRAGYFPNVRVTTQHGERLRFYDDCLRGRLVVVNFFFTECDELCPHAMANLREVQRILGTRVNRDIFMYSISLKAREDGPSRLRAYAESHGVGGGWRLLTGAPSDIERLRRRLGFVDPDPVVDADTTAHIGVVLFGSEPLDRWAACPSLTPPRELARYIDGIDPSRRTTGESSVS